MFWELSADKSGADNLVAISAANIGALDTTPNHLNYPYSQFDNIKNNMGGGSGTTVVTPPPSTTKPVTSSTTTKTTSAPATTTTTPGTGGCAGIAAWSSGIAYTGGNVVSYGGTYITFCVQ